MKKLDRGTPDDQVWVSFTESEYERLEALLRPEKEEGSGKWRRGGVERRKSERRSGVNGA